MTFKQYLENIICWSRRSPTAYWNCNYFLTCIYLCDCTDSYTDADRAPGACGRGAVATASWPGRGPPVCTEGICFI